MTVILLISAQTSMFDIRQNETVLTITHRKYLF